MQNNELTYDLLVERITRWADGDPNVRLAMVIGSRARTDIPADEWSDLDVVLAVKEAAKIIGDSSWLSQIGPYWLTFIEGTSTGRDQERRVLFEGGLDVDFATVPVKKTRLLIWGMQLHARFPALLKLPKIQQQMRQYSGFFDIANRGMLVLVDKDGVSQVFSNAPKLISPYEPPGKDEFLNAVGDFWYHTAWTAKHLRRGELWWAKSGLDMHLKGLLLRMLEWHARAMKGNQYDTWMRGRFLEIWADPRAVAGLREAFAHYDEKDIQSALAKTMSLYQWLSQETAERWGFPLPAVEIQQTMDYTRSILF